jgi:hypothetical protein
MRIDLLATQPPLLQLIGRGIGGHWSGNNAASSIDINGCHSGGKLLDI